MIVQICVPDTDSSTASTRARSTRERAPSLRKAFARWNSTVLVVTKSSAAASRLVAPRATASATWSSREVNVEVSERGVVFDGAGGEQRAAGPDRVRRAAGGLEALQGRVEVRLGLGGAAAVHEPLAASELGPCREQRPAGQREVAGRDEVRVAGLVQHPAQPRRRGAGREAVRWPGPGDRAAPASLRPGPAGPPRGRRRRGRPARGRRRDARRRPPRAPQPPAPAARPRAPRSPRRGPARPRPRRPRRRSGATRTPARARAPSRRRRGSPRPARARPLPSPRAPARAPARPGRRAPPSAAPPGSPRRAPRRGGRRRA